MPFAWSRKPKVDGRPSWFQGRFFQNDPLRHWSKYIPVRDIPVKYLEIGCADGANVIMMSKTFCKHPSSKIYCVDPWMDYDEYNEYKGQQDIAWTTFNTNIRNSGESSKITIKRGFSDDIVPTFEDNFFDLVYVDGNHETEYVYRDGVMSLQKVKSGGYIVFDDYNLGWKQTMSGIDKFLEEFKTKIKVLGVVSYGQLIIQKL